LSLFVFSNGIFSALLWRYIEYPWKRLDSQSLNRVYGIVVLSSGRKKPLGNTKIIEWEDPDRFFAGVELYKSGKGSKLIFTGGSNPYSPDLPPEGNIYSKEAVLFGVPSKDIITTQPVLNTLQEAKAIKQLLDEKMPSSQKRIILVTSAFHMKRAKNVFEKEGFRVQPFPVDFKSNKNLSLVFYNPLSWVPSSTSLHKTSFAIREIIGQNLYKVWKK